MSRISSHAFLALVITRLCPVMLGAPAASGQQILYHAMKVPALPGAPGQHSAAFAINESGQVTGLTPRPGSGTPYAFRWDPHQGIISLGWLLGGPAINWGNAISNLGHVAGSHTWIQSTRQFWWTPETGMVSLGHLPGAPEAGEARGINDLDQVVGIAASVHGGQSTGEAFLWDPIHGMIGLGSLAGPGFPSHAYDINNSSQVTGFSQSAQHYSGEAFIWDPDQGMQSLGPIPGGGYAYVGRAINELGQICGGAHTPKSLREAYLWDPQAGFTLLGLPPVPDPQSDALALNDLGQVVGLAVTDWYLSKMFAFIWDAQRGMRRLDELLDASSIACAPLHQARGINNAGQIISTASCGSDVLLTPFVLGDMNCDGEVNYDDIGPFVLALVDLAAHAQQYPDCHGDWAGDVNQDAAFNAFDIDPFVLLLTNP